MGAFEKFGGGNRPKTADPNVEILYSYEKHYMDLVKSYRHEIEFINELHTDHIREVQNFYREELPQIQNHLAQDSTIDEETKREWLKHLENHISDSFEMSEKFISILTTKKLEEFNTAIRNQIAEQVR